MNIFLNAYLAENPSLELISSIFYEIFAFPWKAELMNCLILALFLGSAARDGTILTHVVCYLPSLVRLLNG